MSGSNFLKLWVANHLESHDPKSGGSTPALACGWLQIGNLRTQLKDTPGLRNKPECHFQFTSEFVKVTSSCFQRPPILFFYSKFIIPKEGLLNGLSCTIHKLQSEMETVQGDASLKFDMIQGSTFYLLKYRLVVVDIINVYNNQGGTGERKRPIGSIVICGRNIKYILWPLQDRRWTGSEAN